MRSKLGFQPADGIGRSIADAGHPEVNRRITQCNIFNQAGRAGLGAAA